MLNGKIQDLLNPGVEKMKWISSHPKAGNANLYSCTMPQKLDLLIELCDKSPKSKLSP